VTVEYVTNTVPMFDEDFAPLRAANPVKITVDPTFEGPFEPSDWTLLIPTGSLDERFYSRALRHAQSARARMMLVSFETANWMNGMIPHPKDPMAWEPWRRALARGGLVVTSAREGLGFARDFYGARDNADLRFAHWHPPINDRAVPSDPGPRQERIVAFMRTEDRHKGARDLLEMDPAILRERTLALIFGRDIDPDYVQALRRHFSATPGARLELYNRISDATKFALLATSRLHLFPSWFEGYGYPPIEAAYVGTPTVSYDLPVVRETVGEAATYVPVGDARALSQAVLASLAEPMPLDIAARLRIAPDVATAGQKLRHILERNLRVTPPASNKPPARRGLPPRRGLARRPEVTRERAAASGTVRVGRPSARVSAGILTVVGRVDRGEAGDQVRLVLDGVAVATAPLLPAEGAGPGYELILPLSGLKPQIDRFELAVSRGTKVVGRVSEPLPLDFATRVTARCWVPQLRPHLGSSVDRRRLVFALDLDGESPSGAAWHLCAEIANAARMQGGLTSLIYAGDGEAAVEVLDDDLLPLFDHVEAVPPDLLADRTRERADGAATVTNRRDVSGADGAVVRVRDAAGGSLMLLGTGRGEVSEITYQSAGALGFRSAQTDGEALTVAIGGRPHEADPALVEAVIETVSTVIRGAPVLILLQDGLSAADTIADAENVRRAGLADLAGAVQQASRAIVIDIGGPDGDPVFAARLAAAGLGHRLVVSGPQDLQALAERVRQVGAVPDLPRSLELILSAAGFAPVEDCRSWPRGVAQAQGFCRGDGTDSEGIVLKSWDPGMTLSFSPFGGRADEYAAYGWTRGDEFGARMQGNVAILAFALPFLPEETLRLSALVRRMDEGEQAETLDLWVDGLRIGQIRLTSRTPTLQTVNVPRETWRQAKGAHTLSLVRSGGPSAEISVLAIGLHRPAEPMDWTTIHALAEPTTPLSRPWPPGGAHWSFGSKGTGQGLLTQGWSKPEDDFTWSDGSVAVLTLPERLVSEEVWEVRITTAAFAEDGADQGVTILAGGEEVARLRVRRASETHAFLIPAEVTQRGLSALTLELPDAVSPLDRGLGEDRRRLGLQLHRLSLVPIPRVTATGEPFSWDTDKAHVVLRFGQEQATQSRLRAGWAQVEEAWVWSEGAHAELALRELEAGVVARLRIPVHAYAPSGRPQRVRIGNAGVEAACIQALDTGDIAEVVVHGDTSGVLKFGLPDRRSPAWEGGLDARELGMRLSDLWIGPLVDQIVEDDCWSVAVHGAYSARVLGTTSASVLIHLEGRGQAPAGLRWRDQSVLVRPEPGPDGWAAMIYAPRPAIGDEGLDLLVLLKDAPETISGEVETRAATLFKVRRDPGR